MEETYTFSRALHMMRYSGKKMRYEMWDKSFYCFVDNNEVCFMDTGINDLDRSCDLSSREIIGSWVEVK